MKKEMIKQTLNDIAELIYEDEIKEAEASLEAYANQRVVEELEKLPKQYVPLGATITISYFDVLTRIKELKQD